ncbi:hypothetical protein LTR91_021057 [Friedmanniomyces endolithicus]|uniref:Glycoside hydrolase 131 catalytic N-terminal domain-containing protein n=1 Tax=Friedmanniomyces endolithicus TaxID=329885 RepID=A0AAN6K4N9_9PEZI|nr:hypothetical protein LTR94_010888 [Friedmanniomyces endolithicus]KAK0793025.1 hypothetical protein LTR38_009700 [Friedmanniomyces endolithicus]KAK0802185.1 hypothetical protein LTR59_005199 [Friedmanniomyces endolithicus]KAK0812279.1 hypothetical protein LTR75_005045 [Friedmanniomyces endolithicus]KAK0841324.1 hypothetical protein LTR03_009984 [Friedmanniomyces endolithicus]
MFSSTTMLALIGSATATILWDGRLNNETSSAFLDDWSFSNTVGQYQYYIHGTGPVTDYVNLATSYKNPADSGSAQGIQVTIDNSSVWNSDNMLRTELIPQTKAPINKGKVFYHFSVQHTATNPPSPYEEHQVCFFESHFTELKYGLIDGEQGTLDQALRWDVNGETHWNVSFAAGVWHNIAYAIDFDAGSVGFYHSTGSDDLTLIVPPVSVSASSNGADWHLGVLRLPSSTGRSDTAAEDWHFSGVYIESGEITTSISGPGGASSVSRVSSSAAASVASSSTAPAPSSSTKTVVSSVVPTSISKLSTSSSTKPTTASTSIKPTSSSIKPTTSSTTIKPTTSSASIKPTTSSEAPATSTAKPATGSAATSSSKPVVSTPVSASTPISKPTTSSAPASSYSAVRTTLSTLVRSSSSSSEAAPVTASRSTSAEAPVRTTSTHPHTSASASSAVTVAPVSTSVAISSEPLSSASAPTTLHSQHSSSSSSSAVSPVSTSEPSDECVVNYIYV